MVVFPHSMFVVRFAAEICPVEIPDSRDVPKLVIKTFLLPLDLVQLLFGQFSERSFPRRLLPVDADCDRNENYQTPTGQKQTVGVTDKEDGREESYSHNRELRPVSF